MRVKYQPEISCLHMKRGEVKKIVANENQLVKDTAKK